MMTKASPPPPTTVRSKLRTVASETVVPPSVEMVPYATPMDSIRMSRPLPTPIAPSLSGGLFIVLARLHAAYHRRGWYRAPSSYPGHRERGGALHPERLVEKM